MIPRRVPARCGGAAAEAAFLVEESGTHERPRFRRRGAAPAAAAHVARRDETISSETAINLDQGDPLAEADFHMAYGLYDQAADLIRIAISREPDRRDLKLKLLEVFFVWGNKEQFLQHRARAGATPRRGRARASGKRLSSWASSSRPKIRCSPVAAASAAPPPVASTSISRAARAASTSTCWASPSRAAHGDGVDLDIGSALGEREATARVGSGVTDRNAALLENSLHAATRPARRGR